MFLPRVIPRFPANQFYKRSVVAPTPGAGFTVLNSSGASISVSQTVLNSSGTGFAVSDDVLNSSGVPFTVI